jgi:hypothetical protein
MRAISAADSVSPAIERTRNFLFRPFNWGTYLKLGLVAIVTEGIGSNLRSSSHGGGQPTDHGPMIHSLAEINPLWVAEGVAALMLGLIFAAWLFYLVTRLRFAFFHCLVHNTREIRPGWWLLREPATRFFWMNVGVGVCYLLVVAAISIPFISGFLRLFHEMPQGGAPNIPLLLSLVLPLIPIIFLLVVVAVLLDVLLRDWMLPHYALEDASAGEAFAAVWSRVVAEKREFFVYALLRLILPAIAMVAVFIVLLIPGLILAGTAAAVEYGIHSGFADATGAAAVVGIALQVFFGAVAFGFALLFGICIGGPVSTSVREYALVFYGGRYQTLGNILYPPAAAPGAPAAG